MTANVANDLTKDYDGNLSNNVYARVTSNKRIVMEWSWGRLGESSQSLMILASRIAQAQAIECRELSQGH